MAQTKTETSMRPPWWHDRSFTEFKLPKSFEQFASRKKEISPFERFHKWAAKKAGGVPAGRKISVSAVWLHEKDAKALRKLTYDWIREFHCPKNLYRASYAQKTLGFHDLDLGPSAFRPKDHPPGIAPGKVYLELDSLFEEAADA